jgi:hypothetical protein
LRCAATAACAYNAEVSPRPAHVKGGGFLSAVKALRTYRDTVLLRLAPELHHYLDERILPAGWYSEYDLLALVKVLTTVFPIPHGAEPWETCGRLTAQADLAGIYRAFLRAGEPGATLESVANHWRTYHDTGDMLFAAESDSAARITLRQYAIIDADMCRLNGGYLTGILIAAGAKNVRMVKLECRAAAAAQCVWRLSWS